jgi:hypothetical protein
MRTYTPVTIVAGKGAEPAGKRLASLHGDSLLAFK